VTCNDGNLCTDDYCDVSVGCKTNNNTVSCNDNTVCTTSDQCTGGACSGTTVSCDDANACTTDSCNATTGCSHATACTIGQLCVTNSDCISGNCTGSPKACGAVVLVSLAVTPAGPLSLPRYTLANGTVKSTQQFVATATFSDGTQTVVTSSATWTSGTTATATIAATGLATANTAYGTTVITASYTTGGVTKTGTQTLNIVCPVLVNEVQTGSGASSNNDEEIELYNNFGATASLNGYTLRVSGKNGAPTTVYTYGAAESIANAVYQVYANKGHVGTVTGQWSVASGDYLAANGGSAALVDAGGMQCDGVGWGNGSPTYSESTLVTANVPTGTSAGGLYFLFRHPNGSDSNVNATDFIMSTTAGSVTMGAANP
jgi:hypothetical protein